MIYYLAREKSSDTMATFLAGAGSHLAGRITILAYEKLLIARDLPRGTYIFSDIERLSPKEAESAARVWEELAAQGARLLNHPTRSMRRYELLRTLYERGLSCHNVYRLTEGREPQRFPVFVRHENDHHGPRTPLLRSPEELEAARAEIDRQGTSREDKLITEFCDTSDGAGMFRKYSAFIVGERIVARHVFCSRDWIIKLADGADLRPDLLREELDYVEGNPHEAQLREIFHLAGIDYGRIDYGLLEGRPQVWEINTNPQILSAANAAIPERRPSNGVFVSRVTPAFEAIDDTGGAGQWRLSEAARLSPARRLKLAWKVWMGRALASDR